MCIWFLQKMYLFDISCRFIELVLVLAVGLILPFTSEVPNSVYYIQGLEDFERSTFPGILLSILSLGSPLLMLAFQVFVYFGLTNQSNNLLSFKCTILLLVPFNIPIIFVLAKVDMKWITFAIYLMVFVKYFLVPVETLYSHSEAKNHFKINHPKLMTLPSSQVKISFASSISYIISSLTSLKNMCVSNQVAPIDDTVEMC